ncbi:hypothetical protein [Bacillus nitratireducens]|uniref:hypothetical protein n=1 Tax=Bacillus nitratireducens TaxID=2026193 RepID=UPI00089570C6|nr:hypothetical protein [Bacillus nitratireducens]SEB21138.1 hypothetical protein SAMN04488146_1229 [Bacillus nitratireducens]
MILSVLNVFKTFILQVLGILVIEVFVAISFYYLAYLLFGIIVYLFINIESIIAAIGFVVYLFG